MPAQVESPNLPVTLHFDLSLLFSRGREPKDNFICRWSLYFSLCYYNNIISQLQPLHIPPHYLLWDESVRPSFSCLTSNCCTWSANQPLTAHNHPNTCPFQLSHGCQFHPGHPSCSPYFFSRLLNTMRHSEFQWVWCHKEHFMVNADPHQGLGVNTK